MAFSCDDSRPKGVKLIVRVKDTSYAVECEHINLTKDGTCVDCGIQTEISEIIGNNSYQKKCDRSILPDMEKLPFATDIKNRAEAIFHQMTQGTRRGERRKQQIFTCLTAAHQELGIPIDPKSIADAVGISTGNMTSALSMYSYVQTGYRPVKKFTKATDLLPQYCTELGLSEDIIDDIVDFGESIIEKNKECLEMYPQKLAGGILKYYSTLRGISLPPGIFSKIMKLSEATINTAYKEVARIDNQS